VVQSAVVVKRKSGQDVIEVKMEFEEEMYRAGNGKTIKLDPALQGTTVPSQLAVPSHQHQLQLLVNSQQQVEEQPRARSGSSRQRAVHPRSRSSDDERGTIF
jgi:hypothetical protein